MNLTVAQYRKLSGKTVEAKASRPYAPYRSKTEAEYAGYLELLRRAEQIVSWEYEADKLELANRHTYKPDFWVAATHASKLGFGEYHEVKGRKNDRPFYKTQSARDKVKVAARTYPMVPFFVVWPDGRGGWNKERVKA